MMTIGDIAARIEALKAKVVGRVVEQTGITMADVVAGLAKIAFAEEIGNADENRPPSQNAPQPGTFEPRGNEAPQRALAHLQAQNAT